MLILALDTSSAAGSAAIVRDGAVIAQREGDGSRMHGERLPLELMTILRDAAISLDNVDAFAVVTGPGSFTGLRVGIATIQGLALARRQRIVPVTTFEALASQLDHRSSDVIGVWIDGHRREIFAALYAADGRTTLEPPTSLTPEATIDAWMRTIETGARVRFAGDGAIRHADVIRSHLGERAILPDTVPALAGAAGLIAAADPDRAVAPHAIVPLYVRRSYVEIARDRAGADAKSAQVQQPRSPRPKS